MQTKLSNKSINIIKNSAPLVTSNAYAITELLYKLLFMKYPHIQLLFKNAPDNQSDLLAEAVSAYATNIENITILLPALEVIAQTHAKLLIQPSHYTMVGIVFIQALDDVLKNAATLEFLDAWREAYKFLANTLIDLQNKIYNKG